MAKTTMPVQPAGTAVHVPEFITNMPDPSTGIPREDGDGDIHDNIYADSVATGHYGAATHEGDMGRLSKV